MEISWQEVVETTHQYRDLHFEYWFNESLFTFRWWALFITTLVPLIVWPIIVDKKRIFEIMTYGFMVTVIAVISDKIGASLLLWKYKHTLTPVSTLIEVHIIQMPLIYMIIYQYFKKWKSFLIAVTINAYIFAFVLEPLLVWLQIYELYKWKTKYSFLPYILIAVLCKSIINKLKQSSKK